MASSGYARVLFFIALTFPTSLFGAHTPPSSFTALNQLKYWSENVQGTMPGNLLSKLSPLNKEQAERLTSLVSKKNLPLDSNYCSVANLACSPRSLVVNMRAFGAYGYGRISPSLVQHVDPSSFFEISLLKQGSMMHLSNLENQLPQHSFLPSQIASKFSVVENDLQKLFPQSFKNPRTKDAIQSTLIYCNTPPLKEEIQSCVKSLEDMIEFAKTAIAYAVDVLEPKTKLPINTVMVICHMDTSNWSPNHVAFKLLKSSPGKVVACHWVFQNDLLFFSAEED
ncbi:polygalacturonase 1 beta-like protein 3 [Coffea eugenioides]|uniref:polygalacturonase 1 beta-like protein 3 n=1 Tax=Coffea eugenioides TaxID=49369 RepID=UPI000F60A306|nr:polygalacturonase 1 beta-like protein 3 [Coffea eugenioides]